MNADTADTGVADEAAQLTALQTAILWLLGTVLLLAAIGKITSFPTFAAELQAMSTLSGRGARLAACALAGLELSLAFHLLAGRRNHEVALLSLLLFLVMTAVAMQMVLAGSGESCSCFGPTAPKLLRGEGPAWALGRNAILTSVNAAFFFLDRK